MSLFRIDTHPPAHRFDKPSPTPMGGTVFDPVQDKFWDSMGQRYGSTKIYRTSLASGSRRKSARNFCVKPDMRSSGHLVQSMCLNLIRMSQVKPPGYDALTPSQANP